jgi:hypothetical protein
MLCGSHFCRHDPAVSRGVALGKRRGGNPEGRSAAQQLAAKDRRLAELRAVIKELEARLANAFGGTADRLRLDAPL